MALGREPWTAAFWAVCAPFLFPVIMLTIATSILIGDGQLPFRVSWLVICIAVALQFGIISVWSDRLGAGPFSGAMQADGAWVMTAFLAGPFILFVPIIVVGSFMPADGNWIYRDGVDPEIFSKANWTLSLIFYAIILAPIIEEVTYRGVAMGAIIAKGGSPVIAAVAASAAFTLPHLQYSAAAMFAVFVSGLGFAALRLMSGSVIVPIVAHMAANSVSFLMQLFPSPPAT